MFRELAKSHCPRQVPSNDVLCLGCVRYFISFTDKKSWCLTCSNTRSFCCTLRFKGSHVANWVVAFCQMPTKLSLVQCTSILFQTNINLSVKTSVHLQLSHDQTNLNFMADQFSVLFHVVCTISFFTYCLKPHGI